MSETAVARADLAPFCTGIGIDIGFGGDPIVPDALTFDMPTPYTSVGGCKQILRGDARDLSFLCTGSLDYVYSSHLVEDFTYSDQIDLMIEWRRVLKSGGLLIIYCPDEAVYAAHCAATGQDYNLAHKERDFSLDTFIRRALYPSGLWEVIHQVPLVNTYSWELVAKKL
jgi:SAM-dependent methyltransferase